MEDEEWKKLPPEDRCVHKLWKARVSGYEDVAKLFRQIDDDKSPEFSKYLGLVKKFVVDSNAMGQEKGLEATLAYVENYAQAGKTVSEVMSGVVGKCIAAPKTRTRDLALQITLMYIEIEKFEAVQEELLKGMEQKNPKIVAACINASTVSLREYGSKVVSLKPLVKKIPLLFADRDKAVRDEARQLVVEMYRWIGGALRSQLSNLQPVQVTELETEFAKVEGQKAIPTRYIRSQQQKQIILATESEEVDGGGSDEGEADDDATPQLDPYDLADPVDILSKLPKDFYEKVEAKKWQERKEALEALEILLKQPKLQNGDYGDLVRILKKIIEKDSNVVVVALAGRCLAGLANGLKKRFQPYAVACISSLLEKFKEKKQNVVIAIKEAIDAVYLATTMEAILEDVIEALGNKNPSVKAETAFFLARAFTKTSPTVFNKKTLKLLTTALLKNINEPDPTVRDSSAEAIGTLMKLVGEKAIAPFLVELEKDNLKMTKIKECCDKAVIVVKLSGIKKERPTTAPVKSGTKVVKTASSQQQPRSAPNVTKTINTATIIKKKADSSGKPIRPKSKGNAKASGKVVSTERILSDEEVDEIIANIVSGNVVNEIFDTNWKTRLAAVEQFFKEIQSLESKDIPTQAVIKILCRKPGLKDTNFQVLKAKLDFVKYLAENSNFTTTSTECCISDIIEKFGDPKNGTLVGETMTSIAEATILSHISTIVIETALNQKNPKVIQESLIWLGNAIKDFGFANLNAKLFIENAKKALGSTNPGVRQAAITFCGVLYLYMGPPLNVFFENEKPALREQISVEFDKYEGMKPPPPSKGIIKSCSMNSIDDLDENGDGEPDNNIPNVADLLPRIDISGQITESLLNEINDKNWKVRNEALTKLSTIIQEAKFIKPNIGDLPQALTPRLSDSNTKIAQTAMNICEAIAKAMGSPCKQYIKVFFPIFLQNLGDSKSWIRTAARETIDTYAEQCGYKEFFENEMIADALKNGSPTLRIELWAWLAEKLPKITVKSIPKEELVICIPHLYTNLEDRNADVRKNAQEAILGIMIHVGYECMVKHTEKLKPGSKNVIMTILEKVRPNLPAKPLPKKQENKKEEKSNKIVKSAGNKTTTKAKTSGNLTKTTAVSSRKKEEDIDSSPLLVVNNMKHQRTIDESKLRVLKWNFTTPREEFVDLLKDQMSNANVNKTLMANMFHTDFRYHIKAIESLMDDLQTNGPALVANLDLILKWLTLRFFDTNPSVLLKGLEYLHLVFNMLIETNYNMLENEASSFLPYLVVKIGDPKDSVRNGVRSLFKQICHIYQVGRLFTYIMEGVKSKNARQRAECLEAMSLIIQDYGIIVCNPSPAVCLKEVAKQISDRDNSVRNAALNCVVQAYNIVGDKVYKMVGNISDKDLSLLEERIKRSSRKNPIVKPLLKQESCVTVTPAFTHKEDTPSDGDGDVYNENSDKNEEDDDDNLPPVMMPPKIVQEVNEPPGPFCLDPQLLNELDNIKPMVPTDKVKEFDLSFLVEDVNVPKLSAEDIRAKIMPLSPPKPLDPNLSITGLSSLTGSKHFSPKKQDPALMSSFNQIMSNDLHIVVQGLEKVSDVLVTPRSNTLIDYENEFMRAIATQLKQLRNQDPTTSEDVTNVYRSILTVIDSFYSNKTLGKQVSVDTLKMVMNELIHVLVMGKLENCHSGDAFIRVINLHCVKIIEKSDHTKIICALIKLMHECIQKDIVARHTDLVMKCLWRVIKQMPNWGDDVDYDSILLEIHNFLKEFPSVWWKNKPTDTALRTIKTIVHSTVKIKRGSIMLHFGKIPNTSESEVESYVHKLLKTMNVESVKQSPRVTLSRASHSMLTEIFQKIAEADSKDEAREGLILLHDFMQKHPEADIEPFLKRSSQFFQDYIQNGLREIEESRKSSKTVAEKVEEKVAQTITSSTHHPSGDLSRKGPEYWAQRLNQWTKVYEIYKNTDE